MLAGRRAVVCGVTNHRSLGWVITKAIAALGCEVLVTFQAEKQEGTVRALLEKEPGSRIQAMKMDVRVPGDVERLRDVAGGRPLHAFCHSMAFAAPEIMRGGLLCPEVDDAQHQQAWADAFGVSCYSLVQLVRALEEPLAEGGASVMSLSYLGAERAVQGYSVMGPAKAALEATVRGLALELGDRGVRVNCISAGPVDTVSSRGIPSFRGLKRATAPMTMLGDHPSASEIGQVAAFLATDASKGITGQTLYVDGGFSSCVRHGGGDGGAGAGAGAGGAEHGAAPGT